MTPLARPRTAPGAARPNRAARRAAARGTVVGARTPVRHVTLPFCITATADTLPGETIADFLARTEWAAPVKIDGARRWSFRLPTVCVVNGTPVLQREWKRVRIGAADSVEFWSRPWGKGSGGGKQILGIVALIALAAFAPWAGGALAGALGLGSVASSIITGAILMGGGLLINALAKPKPAAQSDTTDDQVAQLSSVSASGNAAKLLQPIPVQYGRIKSFPDWAIQPWSEFSDNDQYLNVLLSVGLGKYSYESLYIDDTILWTSGGGLSAGFSGVQIEFYNPGDNVTLFPTNVVQSVEVSGQEITTTPIGGFVASPSGSITTDIAFDIVFPAGLFHVNSDTGKLEGVAVQVRMELQLVDDAGAPLGDWQVVQEPNFFLNSRQPTRRTIKTPTSPGRYAARVSRLTAPSTDTNTSDSVVWAGLRGFITGPSSYPVSTVAIRILASSQLTQASADRFGVLCTRILPVWNGTNFVEQATRNPFWAEYDAAVDTNYGAGRPPSKVDFQTVVDQATAATSRGDHFDFRFTSAVPVPDALDTILRVIRSRHRWSGDVLTFVRDEWATVPRMLLTDREIVRGTLSLEYAINTDSSADAVVLQYQDENTWGPAQVQYPANSGSFTSVTPTIVTLPGVVNRTHAFRECAFLYLQSQFRRINIGLDTEHDGRMLGFGSRVRVQTELPLSWGFTGVVVGIAGNTLTLSPAPTWALSGSHFIAIRTKTGRQFGPVLCSKGANTSLAILDATDLAAVQTAQSMTVAEALARANGADDPSFDFGPGSARARDCIVMTGRPSNDRVTLGLVVDNIAVHDTDPGTAPVAPSAPALRDPPTPVIAGLYATFRQGVAEPILDASWVPAPGAQYYVADVSYDSGTTWTPIYQGNAPLFSHVVARAALRLRVQGVGVRSGAYEIVDLIAPTITIAQNTVDLRSLVGDVKAQVTDVIDNLAQRIADAEQQISALASNTDARAWNDVRSVRSQLSSVFGLASAEIDSVSTVATSNTAAIATLESTVGASFGPLIATVDTLETAVATLDGYAAARYAVTLTVDGYASGFSLINGGTPAFSNFTVTADTFQVAFPGHGGGAPVSVFSIQNVAGVAKLAFRGDMFADGTITASALNVTTLTAITGNFGTATVNGTISSQNGKLVIDFANNNITFSD